MKIQDYKNATKRLRAFVHESRMVRDSDYIMFHKLLENPNMEPFNDFALWPFSPNFNISTIN